VGIIMSTTGIAPSLLGLPGAIRRLRDGDSIGGWFIVAWIGYFVASATLIGVVRGYVPANDWTMHSFQIGATLDMLVFMYIAMRQTAMRLREQRRLRRSFSGYVSPGVLAEIIGGRLTPDTGGENRFVCLLFSDIRGYTTRAEGMKPREVLDFLNRYYDRVVAIVHRNGGTVISFMGDGFLAVFGAPQVLDNPCQSGFEAAGEMLRHMRELDRELAAEGVAPIDIGIGLHAGEAVLGHIGGAQRHEYAAIGDVTNVCARLEAQTKEVGYRLVVSGTVVERLTTSTPPVRLGLLKLKGHSPVEAYAFDPVAESGAANSWSATTIARVDTPKGR
jgi:class 3 adenylate cyclase